MSSRCSNEKVSLIESLLILSSRTFRVRKRCCRCVPIVLVECILPLIFIGLLVFLSNYVLNQKNEFFQTNFNDKCSTRNESIQLSLSAHCPSMSSSFYSDRIESIDVVIRHSMESAVIDKLIAKMRNDECRFRVVAWRDVDSNDESEMLFGQRSDNVFVIVFDIKQMNSKLFEYDMRIAMSDSDEFNEQLIDRLHLNFVSHFASPSEEVDLFQRSIPPFADVKLLLDKTYLDLFNEDESNAILSKLNLSRIVCVEGRSHPSIPSRWLFILILYSMSLLYLLLSLFVVYSLNKEKNEKMKEILEIVDLSSFAYYLSWALIYLVLVSCLTFVIISLMKVNVNGWTIFENVSLKVLVLSITLTNVQLVVYSMFVSQTFVNYSNLFVLNVFVYIAMNICSLVNPMNLVSSLNPYFSLLSVFRLLFLFERSKIKGNLLSKEFDVFPRLTTVYLLIVVSIFVYSLLIWYLDKLRPSQYGIRLKWNFCFQLDYWLQPTDSTDRSRQSNDSVEDEENVVVRVENLTKTYGEGNVCVLKSISFNLYSNEITSLLGQNGAGKSTLMNILSGFIEQTSGNVSVNRDSISYCPQHDILFDLLTVREQVEFYCKCKRMNENIDETISTVLESIDLLEHENVFCQNLSGGMKRRVSLGCAFIGETKLILLDEPSSGVDPFNRRFLWDWIRTMKRSRTILLTTHFLEEADYLSDQIIILNEGRVVAINSPSQLKRIYGNGFKLILYKNPTNSHVNLFDLIRNWFDNCRIEMETKNQLIIQTNVQSSERLSKILFQFDLLKQNEIIRNYCLSQTNLEDVFTNLVKSDEEMCFDEIHDRCHRLYSSTRIEEESRFYVSQLHGLAMKSLVIVRETIVYLFVVVVMSFVVHLCLNRQLTRREEIVYSFDKIDHLLNSQIYVVDHFTDKQLQFIQNRYSNLKLISLTNISDVEQFNQFFYRRRENELNNYVRDAIGMLIDSEGSVSLLTSHLLIGYESIHLLSNYFCQNRCSIKSKFTFLSNKKDKKRKGKSVFPLLKVFSLLSCFYGIYPGELTEIDVLVLNLIYIYVIILIVSETKDFVNLMQIFGLNSMFRLFSIYLFSFVLIEVYSLVVYLFFMFFSNASPDKSEYLIRQRLYLLTFVNSLSLLPFVVLISKYFENEFLCGLLVYLLLAVIELVDYIRLMFGMIKQNVDLNVGLYWTMNVFIPSLNSKRLVALLLKGFQKDFCQILFDETNLIEKYQLKREIEENDLSIHLLIGVIQFVIYSLLNVCSFEMNLNAIEDDFDEDELADDVLNERERLLTSEVNLDDPLVCLDLVKRYERSQVNAIDHLTFSLSQGECFALLGLNGAGKTSLFKLLVGIENVSQGQIYFNGNLLRKTLFWREKHIGYCPQYDLKQNYFRVKDYFELFLRLKGICSIEIDETVAILCDLFLLKRYLNKYPSELSGGTRRRMHAALASIPNCHLILLDEPTTGVDPLSRKQMRFVFEYLLNNEMSVVLTSHSMEEAQLLANRFAILDRGQFIFLNSIENLHKMFQLDFYLFIQFGSNEVLSKFVVDLQSQIAFELIEEKEKFLVLKSNEKSLLKLFQTIELLKEIYSIESYDIQPTSIEQIFFQLLN